MLNVERAVITFEKMECNTIRPEWIPSAYSQTTVAVKISEAKQDPDTVKVMPNAAIADFAQPAASDNPARLPE